MLFSLYSVMLGTTQPHHTHSFLLWSHAGLTVICVGMPAVLAHITRYPVLSRREGIPICLGLPPGLKGTLTNECVLRTTQRLLRGRKTTVLKTAQQVKSNDLRVHWALGLQHSFLQVCEDLPLGGGAAAMCFLSLFCFREQKLAGLFWLNGRGKKSYKKVRFCCYSGLFWPLRLVLAKLL